METSEPLENATSMASETLSAIVNATSMASETLSEILNATASSSILDSLGSTSTSSTSSFSNILATATSSILSTATSSPMINSSSAVCKVGGFTCDQQTSIQIATRFSGSLSLLGTMSVIISYFLFARFRTSFNKLFLYAIYGEFFIALMCVLSISTVPGMAGSPYGSQNFCTTQGAISTFFLIWIMLWNMFMAFQCFLAVYVRKSITQLDALHKYYHAIAWMSAIAVTAVVLSLPYISGRPSDHVMKNAYLFCWISDSYKGWRWLYFGPLWFSLAINMTLYVLVVQKLQKNKREISKFTTMNSTDRAVRLFVWRTFVYVGIFCLNWLFPTANRLQGLYSNIPLFWLFMLHAFSAPIGGFLHAIAYFYFAFLLEANNDPSSNNRKSMISTSQKRSDNKDSKHSAGGSSENSAHSLTENGPSQLSSIGVTPHAFSTIPMAFIPTEVRDSTSVKSASRPSSSIESEKRPGSVETETHVQVMDRRDLSSSIFASQEPFSFVHKTVQYPDIIKSDVFNSDASKSGIHAVLTLENHIPAKSDDVNSSSGSSEIQAGSSKDIKMADLVSFADRRISHLLRFSPVLRSDTPQMQDTATRDIEIIHLSGTPSPGQNC